MATKVCPRCEIEKEESDFSPDKSRKDGLYYECKACRAEYTANRRRTEKGKKYTEDNKENRAIYLRKYGQKNKEAISKQKAEYYLENCEAIKAKVKARVQANPEKKLRLDIEYHKNRRATDVGFRIGLNLRNRLRCAVSKNYKAGSAVRDLGCSIDDFKKHIESKFQSGMSWENYGKGRECWNLDHIIPLSAFTLTDRQHVVLACHYLNLQPLWETENIIKGAKY